MNPSVYHIRLSDFELQAERLLDPALRTRAVAVISSHSANGTVMSLSSEAREEGLFSGMKVSLARTMSHSAILLPYNDTLYARMNAYVYKSISKFSPIVEPSAFGQYFLDMTGMNSIYKNAMHAGVLILNDLQSKVEMKSHLGISQNKLVSQISTSVVPEKIYEVPFGEEPQFLSPLHSLILPAACEKKVEKMIRFLWLNRVGQIRKITQNRRVGQELFSAHYESLRREANGEDHSRVQLPKNENTIVVQKVLAEDTNDVDILYGVVQTLAEQTAFKLRHRQAMAKNIMLEIHYTDGFRSAKFGTLDENDNRRVVKICWDLFEKANYRRNRIRSILVNVRRLRPVARQLELFEQPQEEGNRSLDNAIDTIRKRYGFSVIRMASA